MASNWDVALKAEARNVVRCFHAFTSEQRASHAASHRLGHRQRHSPGQFFYIHPNLPNKGFSRRFDAARAVLVAAERQAAAD